jgi:hypothetical protein
MYCKATGCRFAKTHVVKEHICGSCGKKGHGLVECGKPNLIEELSKDDTIVPSDLTCSIYGCKNNTLHTTDGHFCSYCKQFSHSEEECPEYLWTQKVERNVVAGRSETEYKEKKYLQIQARKQMKWAERAIYTIIYAGMGCVWYARRKNNFQKIELFFMHSDNWGQYGPTTDDRPKLDKFLEGYRQIE